MQSPIERFNEELRRLIESVKDPFEKVRLLTWGREQLEAMVDSEEDKEVAVALNDVLNNLINANNKIAEIAGEGQRRDALKSIADKV